MDRNDELSKTMEHSVTKIDVLQSKICVLSNELSEARKTQDTKLSEIRSAVLQLCHIQLSQLNYVSADIENVLFQLLFADFELLYRDR